jgi:hypothetical protein
MTLHVLVYNLTGHEHPRREALHRGDPDEGCASAPPDRSRRTAQTTSIPARSCDNMLN